MRAVNGKDDGGKTGIPDFCAFDIAVAVVGRAGMRMHLRDDLQFVLPGERCASGHRPRIDVEASCRRAGVRREDADREDRRAISAAKEIGHAFMSPFLRQSQCGAQSREAICGNEYFGLRRERTSRRLRSRKKPFEPGKRVHAAFLPFSPDCNSRWMRCAIAASVRQAPVFSLVSQSPSDQSECGPRWSTIV